MGNKRRTGRTGRASRTGRTGKMKMSRTSGASSKSSTIRITKKKGFQPVSRILKSFDPVKDKYISREFQKFGYDLAVALGDLKHKSLYIKLAKETPRVILEKAFHFVKDASNVKSRAKLFMWKLSELRKEKGG